MNPKSLEYKNQRRKLERIDSSLEAEKKEKEQYTLYYSTNNMPVEPTVMHPTNVRNRPKEIFRPRSLEEDHFSAERRLFLSTPLRIVSSTGIDTKDLGLISHDITNCENYVSRIEAINSISEDLSKSRVTSPLLEEYRVPLRGEGVGELGYKIYCSSKMIAFKESRLYAMAN